MNDRFGNVIVSPLDTLEAAAQAERDLHRKTVEMVIGPSDTIQVPDPERVPWTIGGFPWRPKPTDLETSIHFAAVSNKHFRQAWSYGLSSLVCLVRHLRTCARVLIETLASRLVVRRQIVRSALCNCPNVELRSSPNDQGKPVREESDE